MRLWRQIFQNITPLKRTIFFVAADGFIFLVSIVISYAIKFGISGVEEFPYEFTFNAIPLFIIIKFFVFFRLRLYQFTWQFVGLNDLYNLLKASTISAAIIFLIYIIAYDTVPAWLPKSVILTDYFISFILTGFLRISKRLFIEIFKPGRDKKGKNTLIIGAGSTGEMIMRDLRKNNFQDYNPVAFLDSDRKKWNTYIHNIPVLGDTPLLKSTVKNLDVAVLIIADHTLSHIQVRDLYTNAKELEIQEVKIVPRLYSLTNVDITVKKLEDIHIEELINRQEIKVETHKIREFLKDKKILITGAAGSIGSEIVRQILLFEPEQLIIFEIDESEIFQLDKELIERFPETVEKVVYIVGDIRDKDKVHSVFERYRPDIVFAAAAYKHVPLMESNAEEAIKVNLFGTYNLCEAAGKCGVSKFINISTDKAVKPVSVMGMTKRLGEYIAQAFNESYDTHYISVRFGNVLGSRGSAIPIFLEQIRKGGPVTVTDPEMKRYFMTIPESVTLVLQAGHLGRGGEVMVLDMGEPILINSIAEELIRLHGLTPGEDIEIIYTGIRPGEKIFEEILTAEEGTTKTTHERIYVAIIPRKFTLESINELLQDLKAAIETDPEQIKSNLHTFLNTALVAEH
jgi:FlaA1/EpsC-like NDP-sugar epimerase